MESFKKFNKNQRYNKVIHCEMKLCPLVLWDRFTSFPQDGVS